MPDTVRSVLCRQEGWTFDSDRCRIAFKEDGTGELAASGDFYVLVMVTIHWKALGSLDAPVDVDGIPTNSQPQLLAQIGLQITLTRELAPYWSNFARLGPDVHHRLLKDEAFMPKEFTVRLERGMFVTPAYGQGLHENRSRIGTWPVQTHALRILFNKSPFPAQSDWKSMWGPIPSLELWEWRGFTSQECPEIAERLKRNLAWGYCIMS